jgi:hypothetical protein
LSFEGVDPRDPRYDYSAWVTWNVGIPFALTPARWVLKRSAVTAGTPATQHVLVRATNGTPFRIVKAVPDHHALSMTSLQSQSASEKAFSVTLDPSKLPAAGAFFTTVRLELQSESPHDSFSIAQKFYVVVTDN